MLRAPTVTGPSATADWLLIEEGQGARRPLRGLPVESGQGQRDDADVDIYFVLAAPGLTRSPGSGRPQFSLTLILEQSPALDDQSLEPLITGAVLALELGISPTSDELDQFRSETGAEAEPLFVRSARWAVTDGSSDEAIAEASIYGHGGSAAFSKTVSRETALAVLAALRGEESDIAVTCDVSFRATPAQGSASHKESSAVGVTTIVTTTTQMGASRNVTLEREFSQIVRSATDELPLDALVSAVCPTAEGTLEPVPWRVESRGQSRGPVQATAFAAIGEGVAALPAVLKTSVHSKINAHALAASGIAIRPPGKFTRWQIADLILHPEGSAEQNQNLPVIEAEAAIWPDRVDSQRYWYAPSFSIVQPAPTMTAADSPFLFAFSVVGMSEDGKPALEAKVKFTLRAAMADATLSAWQAMGQPRAEPVPTNGLSATLILPFINEQSVAAETSISATELKAVEGGYEATFSLTDRFARLAYGALSKSVTRSSQARVELAYCFAAYVPVERSKTPVRWGGKLAKVDARAYRPRPLGIAAIVARPQINNAVLAAVQPNIVAAHPILTAPAIFVRPKTYGIRTQGRNQALEVFVPCSTFGALYVQKGDPDKVEPDKVIGCMDSWTLGQMRLRLYEPLEIDLGITDAPYSIFRSVQVPGRFLVLPKAYTISRYEPPDWRAYRPALFLYSNVDANHPERTSCVLTGTLRPAITPAERATLIEALKAKVHSKPELEWPTELAVAPEFTWALPGGPSQISASAAQTPEGFQVSLGAPLDYILTLKSLVETSGITANVTFPLADGEPLQSTLLIDLSRIDGPFESGAVTAALEGGTAKIRNHVERAADVKELVLLKDGVATASIAVERRIEPEQELVIEAAAGGADEALVNYTLSNAGGTLEEIRTFVEDLHTNVVFVAAFDLAAAGIEKVTVEGRIVGVAGSKTAPVTAAQPSGEVGFVLPLTTYLAEPTLQYRTTARKGDGSVPVSAWRDWRLDLQGNVIELHQAQLLEG